MELLNQLALPHNMKKHHLIRPCFSTGFTDIVDHTTGVFTIGGMGLLKPHPLWGSGQTTKLSIRSFCGLSQNGWC